MSDIAKELSDWTKDSVKDATLAMYSALNTHYGILLNRQSAVIGWLIGLIGAFVGVLVTVETPGPSYQPLLAAVVSLTETDKNALISFVALLGAFILAVELLISYWIYQRYLMSAVISYFKQMESRLGTYLGLYPGTALFVWSDELRGQENTQLNTAEILPKPVKRLLEAL